MKVYNYIIRLAFFLAIGLVLTSSIVEGDKKVSKSVSTTDDVVLKVITNSPTTALSAKALKSIMRGEQQQWSDGTTIKIGLMKTNTEVGSQTASYIYRMTSQGLNKYWLGLVFQGRAIAPQFFSSEQQLQEFIKSTPGAIGVVSHSFETSQKVVKIEGLPGF